MGRRPFINALLMMITIGVIIGFQVYWLKDNYDREKKALLIKTGVAFQETVHRLQAVKLKLPYLPTGDSGQAGMPRIYLDEDMPAAGYLPRQEIITMVNTIRDRMHDSTKRDSTVQSTVVFRMGGGRRLLKKDSLPITIRKFADSGNHLLKVLYRVDSLQDSIRVQEVAASYAGILKNEKIGVLFHILRLPATRAGYEADMSKAVVGFAHPVTYQLVLADTWNYLSGKIFLPFLFSLFLIGVTVFSFVILYRNLLRQQRLADMKNEFVSNISHELKTPIATVGVAIEALKSFHALDDPQKTREYLDISSNELQRLGLLVDRVLKLSLSEKRQTSLNREPFDLAGLIREVLATMRPQFEKQQAVVSFNPASDDFIIQADKLHLTSVVYNLIDNALKYSGELPLITITLSRRRDIFRLEVSDNGMGIAKEYRRKVFDPFFRVPTGNTHAVKGYGLGLSYVAEIIQRHQGYVYVESEPGRGSTFIVEIPVQEADIIWFDDKRSIRKKQIRLFGPKKA